MCPVDRFMQFALRPLEDHCVDNRHHRTGSCNRINSLFPFREVPGAAGQLDLELQGTCVEGECGQVCGLAIDEVISTEPLFDGVKGSDAALEFPNHERQDD